MRNNCLQMLTGVNLLTKVSDRFRRERRSVGMIRSMMGRKKVDRNTLLLLHFDGSLKDEASGKPYVGSNMSYVVGKIQELRFVFLENGYVKIGTNAINESLYPNYTVDFGLN